MPTSEEILIKYCEREFRVRDGVERESYTFFMLMTLVFLYLLFLAGETNLVNVRWSSFGLIWEQCREWGMQLPSVMLKSFISLFLYNQWKEALPCQSNWSLRRQEGPFFMCSKEEFFIPHPPTQRHWIPWLYESGEAVTRDESLNRVPSQWQTRSMLFFFSFFMWAIQSLRHLGRSSLPNLTCYVSLSTATKSFFLFFL